ncbi:MAG: hypothetical protein GWP08_10025 [Nitrospiraceae bacterium]|nr:hypothetical protein [Nitrospiraceae bacterium]
MRVGGGIDTQQTLPFGTAEDVREQVRERVDIFGRGGGFVFNSIHNVQACVPPENLLALFETFQECRRTVRLRGVQAESGLHEPDCSRDLHAQRWLQNYLNCSNRARDGRYGGCGRVLQEQAGVRPGPRVRRPSRPCFLGP